MHAWSARDACFQFRLFIWCSLTWVYQTAVTGVDTIASCIDCNCILQFPSLGSSGEAFPAGRLLSPLRRYLVLAEHRNHPCSGTPDWGKCSPGNGSYRQRWDQWLSLGGSSRDTKVSHLAGSSITVLISTAIATATRKLSPASSTDSTGESSASSRVSRGHAWALETKNRDENMMGL